MPVHGMTPRIAGIVTETVNQAIAAGNRHAAAATPVLPNNQRPMPARVTSPPVPIASRRTIVPSGSCATGPAAVTSPVMHP